PDESLFEAWERYKLSIDRCPNHNMLPVTQIDSFYNVLTLRHRDTINAAACGTFMKRRPEEFYDLIENMTAHHNDWDTSAQRSESSSSIASSFNPKIIALKAEMEEINKNLMRVLQPPLAKCKTYMLREPTKVILTNLKANDAILRNIQTNMTSLTNSNLELKNMFGQFMKMNTASSLGSGTLRGYIITNPKEDLKDALILMPKFGPTIKTLLTNKDKLSEQAITPLNEHCSAVLLKKLPEKLGDPGKFLIPCDFSGMDECLALADLGASINLMPLSVWNKLSLPELSPTCMTLELANRSISRPVGVAEDVFIKVGTFHFLADFVVVDFDVDPRVPLILERSFRMTGRAFIDVFEGELTLRVGKEVITFNLDQTGNPTPYYDPIVSTSSPTLTSFEDSDFLLKEVDAFLGLEDDPTSSEFDHSYFDTEGDILLLEAFLNDYPSLPPPNQGNYLPQVQKELKICEAKTNKSSIDEPPEVELKDLPPHLEYVFLEGDDKLPVIIAKNFSVEQKTAFITILMEDDFKPAVQHQRMVNPKIHDVIKKEVLKLLDARLIYPISDSPWVSLVHCVSKNAGFTVVENEENELILTRLVTGWRVCINYRKLNEATRKDHFPLPFMDQILGRLAGNKYYCFLDGFSSYFQIPIDLKDQENTTFTCPYGTFACRCMPFGLCNAPGTFQRCMMAIFHDMIEK
nr:reverse transcriptase domain-containing protein [Tanacetum cinerariifolium]